MNELDQDARVRDPGLLLHQLENAAFDRDGNDKVAAILADPAFPASLSLDEALLCARLAQMHGLLGPALDIFEQLHKSHPLDLRSWQEHATALALLGRRDALVALRARAAGVLAAASLEQAFADLQNSPEDKADEDVAFADPFEMLHREEERLTWYMKIFSGRADVFARQWRDNKTGGQGYVPVRRSLQRADVRDHISGRKTYGIYLMRPDDTVNVGVLDIDLISKFRDRKLNSSERDQLRREGIYLLSRLRELGAAKKLTGLAEFSGGKGYHFWYPVREPVAAGSMRAALHSLVERIKGDISCFTIEVFPKQDSLKGKGYGNLVKLPLGIHRKTGKPSWFLDSGKKTMEAQLDFLREVNPMEPQVIAECARRPKGAVVVHPRHADWAGKYPELADLEGKCVMLAQIIASVRQAKSLNIREEKILLGTLAHLPRSRVLLHHLFAMLPEYNRPLLDYRISRVRGTPLGCKRIHSLLDDGASLPCSFDQAKGYPHPLLHLAGFTGSDLPKSEKIENLQDAINNLRSAIIQVEKFLPIN